MQAMGYEGSDFGLTRGLWAGSVTLSVTRPTPNRKRGKKFRLYSKVLLNFLLGIDGYCSMAELAYSPSLHTPSFLLITTEPRQFTALSRKDIQN